MSLIIRTGPHNVQPVCGSVSIILIIAESDYWGSDKEISMAMIKCAFQNQSTSKHIDINFSN